MVRRSAFTLIELIFAIVVIAISVVSLPMMSQTVAKGVDANIVQEGIFGAAAQLNEAVTAHWDENSIEPGMPDTSARVIDIDGLCNNNSIASNFRQMPGHINQPLHRRCLDSGAVTPDDDSGTTDISVDLNDMSGRKDIFQGTADADSYKDLTYYSELNITRPAKFNGSNNNNIKRIISTVKIIEDDGTKKTIAVLRTYSANIGEVDYYKRNY